jgi:hypothetical protein
MLGFMADALEGTEVVERLRREKEALAELNARLAEEKLGLKQEIAKLKQAQPPAVQFLRPTPRAATFSARPERKGHGWSISICPGNRSRQHLVCG